MFKLGYIESTGNKLKSFYSIKEDMLDDRLRQIQRGGIGDIFATQQNAKAKITLDLDQVIDSELGDLHEVTQNSFYPNLTYIREPAASSQIITIDGVGNNIAKQWKTNTLTPTLAQFSGTATAFTAGDYVNLGNFTQVLYDTALYDYIHFFYQFDLTTWLASYSLDILRRMTMFMQTPYLYRVSGGTLDNFGYIAYAYNYTMSSWTELKRQPITVEDDNQQYVALRPADGFTQWSDYLSSNLCLFRITNKYLRDSGSIYNGINHIKLLVNGFGVIQENPFNINWRDTYTGGNSAGQFELIEI